MEDSIKKLFQINSKDIPNEVPLFPLENVLLLPFGKLPLNIFEERYIKMVFDSLKSSRLIGIIQPKNNNNEFFMMGCIGKITSFIETEDHRIVLNLEGVCRFILNNQQLTSRGYLQGYINSSRFDSDFHEIEPTIDRTTLIQKFINFFKMKKLAIDDQVLAETSNLQLLSTLAMLAPFNKIDKQAILESPTMIDRLSTINSILDLNTFQVVSNNKPTQLN